MYCFIVQEKSKNEMKKKNNIYFATLKNLSLNNPRNFNEYNFMYENKNKLSQTASILDEISAVFCNINNKCANFI